MEFTWLSGLITLTGTSICSLAVLSIKKPALCRDIILLAGSILVGLYILFYVNNIGIKNGLNTKIDIADSVNQKMLKYSIIRYGKDNKKVDTIITAASLDSIKTADNLVLKYNILDTISEQTNSKLLSIEKENKLITIICGIVILILFFLYRITKLADKHTDKTINQNKNQIK